MQITIHDVLGSLAVILGIAGYVFYIRGILRGEVKPHAFSWSIWGILTAVAFAAQYTEHAGPGSWVTGFTALMSFVFVAVGLRNSARELIATIDWVFFIIALATIPLWYFMGNPVWSVILITAIDTISMIPTVRKAYVDPKTENPWTYLLAGIKFIIGIIALENISLVTTLYPAALVFVNIAFTAFLLWRTKALTAHPD